MPKKRVNIEALTSAAIDVADRDGFEALALTSVAAAATRGWAQGSEVQVTSVVPRWVYIDATLGVRPRPIRFFFPDDDACQALLLRESQVTYASRGPLGMVTNAAGRITPTVSPVRLWSQFQAAEWKLVPAKESSPSISG